jgi:hypothetical protein
MKDRDESGAEAEADEFTLADAGPTSRHDVPEESQALSEMPMEDLAGAMKRRWDQGLNRYLAQRRRDPETLETVETDSPIPPLDLACISAGGRDGG